MADKKSGERIGLSPLVEFMVAFSVVCLLGYKINRKDEKIEQMQRVQDSLSRANDSLQDKVIEYQSALRAYEKRYENQGK